jgi:hypothetical protein
MDAPPNDGPEPAYGPKSCGSCRWWRPILEDERGPIGPCRYSARPGDFPGTAPACEKHLARDEAIPASPRAAPPRRPPRPRAPAVAHREPPASLPPLPQEVLEMTREEFQDAIREALRDEGPDVPLAARWEGGTLVLRPRDPQLQPREIPIDHLFHKVVMIRDRLRVLEQKVNAHPKLSDAEKVEMQTYLTRCYGSLTTFNLLFRDDRDRFVGDKSS